MTVTRNRWVPPTHKSAVGDRLRAIAETMDTMPYPSGVAVIISGDLQYELACKTSDDPERDAMQLGLLIYQASNMKAPSL